MLRHLAIVTIFQYQPFLFNSRLNVLKLTMQFKGENRFYEIRPFFTVLNILIH